MNILQPKSTARKRGLKPGSLRTLVLPAGRQPLRSQFFFGAAK
jgi:hypothetical protein